LGISQYSTNFATQPGYITFPSIASAGQAALPSTVDVFVNNALVAQKTVPPGPFSITNIPTVNGSGNVQLVVRDLFGREQVISQPFYASVNLLKAGLDDFSYEAGVERNNFGTDSGDYGHAVATATYRRGFTDRLTGEIRGEGSRNLGVAGVAASYLIDDIGVASATAATSGGSGGTGALGGAGFQRQTGHFSVLAQALWSSSSFRQIGATLENPVPLRQWSASVGYQLDRYGSASLTYVAQDFRTKENVHIASAGYSVAIGPWAFLGLTAAKIFGEHGSVQISATLTVPLGERTIAAVGYNAVRHSTQANSTDTSFTLQRSVPVGEGYGYRLVAHTLNNQLEADGIWQNNYGTYEVDLSRFEGSNAARASIAGGLGYVGGHPFVSRQITDSFGVVRVADYAGVGILQDNQPGRPHGRQRLCGVAAAPRVRHQPRLHRGTRPAARRAGRQAQDGSRAVLPQRTVARFPGAAFARRHAAHSPRRRSAHSFGCDRARRRSRRRVPGSARRRSVRDGPRGSQSSAGDVERPELRSGSRLPAHHRSAAGSGHVRLPRSGAMKTAYETSRIRRQRIANARRALRVVLCASLGACALDAMAVTCTISAPGIAFGGYDVFAAGPVYGNGTIKVTCTQDPADRGADKIVPYHVTLSTGSSLTFAQRTMKSGVTNTLGYNIYTSNTYGSVWGDGTGSTSIQTGSMLINNGHPSVTDTYTAYGRVPALQDVAVGPYSDNVTVTMSF
jgi:spore coat protein U-like protein